MLVSDISWILKYCDNITIKHNIMILSFRKFYITFDDLPLKYKKFLFIGYFNLDIILKEFSMDIMKFFNISYKIKNEREKYILEIIFEDVNDFNYFVITQI